MFSLFGAPALSQFRLDQLLLALKAEEPRVQALASRWMHFVDTSRPLNDSELDVLGKLLTYGARVPTALREMPGGQRLLVTPRVGTESPWSSKATDIVHVCGLTAVTRVERGTVFFIESESPAQRHAQGVRRAREILRPFRPHRSFREPGNAPRVGQS